MKTFYWLVKREFWEHRGGFLMAPLISAGVVLLLILMGIITGEVLRSRTMPHVGIDMDWLGQHAAGHMQEIGKMLDIYALIPALIVCVVLFFTLFSYCMKTLSSERRDRSILFWKSLPVSDTLTVLSKVFSAVVVAPVIAVVVSAVAAILALLIMGIAASFHGMNLGQVLWTLPHPGQIISMMAGLLPIYMVWMLPSVGWLLLCSAWSRGSSARWVFALPIGGSLLVSWFGILNVFNVNNGWFWENITSRLLFSMIPGSWLPGAGHAVRVSSNGSLASHVQFLDGVLGSASSQYALLATPSFWVGAIAGAAMIAGAVWFRRWRDDS